MPARRPFFLESPVAWLAYAAASYQFTSDLAGSPMEAQPAPARSAENCTKEEPDRGYQERLESGPTQVQVPPEVQLASGRGSPPP
jgi:hypothetical protein